MAAAEIDTSGLDQVGGYAIPLYVSPGDDARARAIAVRTQQALDWLGGLVKLPPLPPLFVLDPSDWDRIALLLQYGLAQAILRHASAFVSHAGMNSIMEALSFGVPLVTLPQVPEQDLNARRVKELGLGELLDADNLAPGRIRGAVLDVAASQQIRARLEWMAGEIARAGGAKAAADAILAELGAERPSN